MAKEERTSEEMRRWGRSDGDWESLSGREKRGRKKNRKKYEGDLRGIRKKAELIFTDSQPFLNILSLPAV